MGLDPNETTRRFKAEAASVHQKTELDFPVPVPERGLPAGAVVLLGVVLAIGAYAGWYRLSGDGRLPAETATQIPMRLASLAEQAGPLVAAPSAPAEPRLAPAEPLPVQQAEMASAPPISPTSAAAASVPQPTAQCARSVADHAAGERRHLGAGA